MTNKRVNLDGYESAVIGLRGKFNRFQNNITMGGLYARGGLFAKVVDLPVDTAMSNGIAISNDEDGLIAAEFDRLKLVPVLTEAARWARLFGGAVILPLSDDGQLEEELNPDAISTISEFRVYDVNDISAMPATYDDSSKSNFGQPKYYELKINGKKRVLVHESRLIPITGEPLPRSMRYNGTKVPWAGRSAVDEAYNDILDYIDTLCLARAIMKRKQQPVYEMEGLSKLIEEGLEAAVQKKIELVDSARGILNTIVVDSVDGYTIHDMNLSGIKEIIAEMQAKLSADSGIAVTILMGVSPGGLNATGKADFDGFYDMCENIRVDRIQPAAERLISLILAQDSVTAPPENWSIVWTSLIQMTDKEQAEIDKSNADTLDKKVTALVKVVENGLIDQTEAHSWLQSEKLFGLDDNGDNSSAAAKSYAAQT